MERNVCKFSYQLSKKLLPVSSSLVGTVNSYYSGQNKGEKFQGISYLLPKLKYDYKIIHNGFDSIFWTNKTNTSKLENSFTAVISPSQYYLKGGDLIIQLAELNSEYTFFLIGINKPPFIDDIPDNIIFLGRISHKEMREYFSKSRFHLQLSIFEGFGCSLCEAMLCECIPIGSNVNIIPEIIGNSGFILQHRDIDELNQLVRSAISGQDKEAKGLSARSRIISKYPIERRINSLVEIIEQ
ncbi:MAG: glycosyltransferase family 4 protein [Bacteroidia bacterium]|nr:glycosyltransferase family 4 protein [Bacteroidia bacterium]